MKKRRYSDEQVVRILHEANKDPVLEVAKRHGVASKASTAGENGFQVRRLTTQSGLSQLPKPDVQRLT